METADGDETHQMAPTVNQGHDAGGASHGATGTAESSDSARGVNGTDSIASRNGRGGSGGGGFAALARALTQKSKDGQQSFDGGIFENMDRKPSITGGVSTEVGERHNNVDNLPLGSDAHSLTSAQANGIDSPSRTLAPGDGTTPTRAAAQSAMMGWQSFNSDSAHSSASLDMMLNERYMDPEEVLLSLGFGGGQPAAYAHSLARVPQRFLIHSSQARMSGAAAARNECDGHPGTAEDSGVGGSGGGGGGFASAVQAMQQQQSQQTSASSTPVAVAPTIQRKRTGGLCLRGVLYLPRTGYVNLDTLVRSYNIPLVFFNYEGSKCYRRVRIGRDPDPFEDSPGKEISGRRQAMRRGKTRRGRMGKSMHRSRSGNMGSVEEEERSDVEKIGERKTSVGKPVGQIVEEEDLESGIDQARLGEDKNMPKKESNQKRNEQKEMKELYIEDTINKTAVKVNQKAPTSPKKQSPTSIAKSVAFQTSNIAILVMQRTSSTVSGVEIDEPNGEDGTDREVSISPKVNVDPASEKDQNQSSKKLFDLNYMKNAARRLGDAMSRKLGRKKGGDKKSADNLEVDSVSQISSQSSDMETSGGVVSDVFGDVSVSACDDDDGVDVGLKVSDTVQAEPEGHKQDAHVTAPGPIKIDSPRSYHHLASRLCVAPLLGNYKQGEGVKDSANNSLPGSRSPEQHQQHTDKDVSLQSLSPVHPEPSEDTHPPQADNAQVNVLSHVPTDSEITPDPHDIQNENSRVILSSNSSNTGERALNVGGRAKPPSRSASCLAPNRQRPAVHSKGFSSVRHTSTATKISEKNYSGQAVQEAIPVVEESIPMKQAQVCNMSRVQEYVNEEPVVTENQNAKVGSLEPGARHTEQQTPISGNFKTLGSESSENTGSGYLGSRSLEETGNRYAASDSVRLENSNLIDKQKYSDPCMYDTSALGLVRNTEPTAIITPNPLKSSETGEAPVSGASREGDNCSGHDNQTITKSESPEVSPQTLNTSPSNKDDNVCFHETNENDILITIKDTAGEIIKPVSAIDPLPESSDCSKSNIQSLPTEDIHNSGDPQGEEEKVSINIVDIDSDVEMNEVNSNGEDEISDVAPAGSLLQVGHSSLLTPSVGMTGSLLSLGPITGRDRNDDSDNSSEVSSDSGHGDADRTVGDDSFNDEGGGEKFEEDSDDDDDDIEEDEGDDSCDEYYYDDDFALDGEEEEEEVDDEEEDSDIDHNENSDFAFGAENDLIQEINEQLSVSNVVTPVETRSKENSPTSNTQNDAISLTELTLESQNEARKLGESHRVVLSNTASSKPNPTPVSLQSRPGSLPTLLSVSSTSIPSAVDIASRRLGAHSHSAQHLESSPTMKLFLKLRNIPPPYRAPFSVSGGPGSNISPLSRRRASLDNTTTERLRRTELESAKTALSHTQKFTSVQSTQSKFMASKSKLSLENTATKVNEFSLVETGLVGNADTAHKESSAEMKNASNVLMEDVSFELRDGEPDAQSDKELEGKMFHSEPLTSSKLPESRSSVPLAMRKRTERKTIASGTRFQGCLNIMPGSLASQTVPESESMVHTTPEPNTDEAPPSSTSQRKLPWELPEVEQNPLPERMRTRRRTSTGCLTTATSLLLYSQRPVIDLDHLSPTDRAEMDMSNVSTSSEEEDEEESEDVGESREKNRWRELFDRKPTGSMIVGL